MIKLFFLLDAVLSLEYLYLFGSDALALYSLYHGTEGELQGSKAIYLVTVVLSILILIVDVQAARRIIASDDISDSFLNDIAYRRQMYRSYSVYCFFYHILDGLPLGQKIGKITYFILKDWKRLLFVDLPQGVIAITSIDSFTHIDTEAQLSEVLLRIKFVIVCVRVGLLVLACLAWPIVRWKLAKRFDNKAFSLEIYVTFTIDYRINQMLGLIVDPNRPGLKPRYKITGADGVERTVTATQKNVDVASPTAVVTSDPTGSPGPLHNPAARLPFPQVHTPAPLYTASTPTVIAPVSPAYPSHSHTHSHHGSYGGHSGMHIQPMIPSPMHSPAYSNNSGYVDASMGQMGGMGAMNLPGQISLGPNGTFYSNGVAITAPMVMLSPGGGYMSPPTSTMQLSPPYGGGPQYTVTM